MHPAQREGSNAGRSAAIEDRHGGHGRAVGAELVIAAQESAADWAADNHPFVDQLGASVAAYVAAFMDAYERWMNEHAAERADGGAAMNKDQPTTSDQVRSIVTAAWQQHGNASAILPFTPKAKPVVTDSNPGAEIPQLPEDTDADR